MRVTLESTTKIVELITGNGHTVPARIWEGHTENGIPCHAYITRIAVARTEDASQFERELVEHRPPTAAVAALNWLVKTSKTAVGPSANAGPVPSAPLVCARIQPLLPAPAVREARIKRRASLRNICGLALPSSAGGGGALAIRYFAPLYERIR